MSGTGRSPLLRIQEESAAAWNVAAAVLSS